VYKEWGSCHADVIGRIADHPATRIDELLPWRWQTEERRHAA
jgi:hypothetical protein